MAAHISFLSHSQCSSISWCLIRNHPGRANRPSKSHLIFHAFVFLSFNCFWELGGYRGTIAINTVTASSQFLAIPILSVSLLSTAHFVWFSYSFVEIIYNSWFTVHHSFLLYQLHGFTSSFSTEALPTLVHFLKFSKKLCLVMLF